MISDKTFENCEWGSLQNYAKLVRDVYSIFPLLIKYTDLHRAKWLKSPSTETDHVYECVAVIFGIWYRSQVCKEVYVKQNYINVYGDGKY